MTTDDVIKTNSMLKMKGRVALPYFIADAHCGGVKLYELFVAMIAHEEIYALYEKRYGDETQKRIKQIRSINKPLLQLEFIYAQMEKLYMRFRSAGESDSRTEKLNPVITRLSKKIWDIAGKLEPLHYMLLLDTVWLVSKTDIGQQSLTRNYIDLASRNALNLRTESQMNRGVRR